MNVVLEHQIYSSFSKKANYLVNCRKPMVPNSFDSAIEITLSVQMYL